MSCCDSDQIKHNDLGSLQGGTTNERYHLTKDQWHNAITGSGGSNIPSVNTALLMQVGNNIHPEDFHLATLTKEQVSTLVNCVLNVSSAGGLSDGGVQNQRQGISITSDVVDGHSHTFTVNYNPTTRKFFVQEETYPEDHTVYFIHQVDFELAFKNVIATAPVYESDVEAGNNSLTSNDIYKTSTGELRYKL